MADEYIKREDALCEVDEWYDLYPDSDAAREALTLSSRGIRKIPAADVAPVVRGKWGVDKSGYPMIVCSECGVKIPVIAGWCMDAHINFCPNCGAKMDGVRRE